MTQMLEIVNKDIKLATLTILYIFKNIEEIWSLLYKNTENKKDPSRTARNEQYNI